MNKINEIINDEITKLFTPINVNNFVYHKSNPIFRNEIKRNGLIPKRKSESWLSNTPIEGKVIFATNSDNPNDWFDSTYDDDTYKINTTIIKNKWYPDPNFSGNHNHIITFEPIPSQAIQLIYKGSGKSTQ